MMEWEDFRGKVDGKKLRAIAERLGTTLEKKNKDYGGASFRMGMPGVYVHVTDKYERFNKAVIDDERMNYESLKDTLMDLAGYCIIGVSMLEVGENEDEQVHK